MLIDPRDDWRAFYFLHTARWLAHWLRSVDERVRLWGNGKRMIEWIHEKSPREAALLGKELATRLATAEGEELAVALDATVEALRRANPWILDPGPDALVLITGTGAPVAAIGWVARHRFSFRARHLGWAFGVALDDAVEPSFIDDSSQGFFREDDDSFPSEWEPSWLTPQQTQQILLRYFTEFRRDVGFGGGP